MENNNSIVSIIVTPRTKNLYKYTLNENWSNPHTLNREKIYAFICNFIKAPATLKALEAIDKRVNFVIFPQKNEVFELSVQTIEEMKKIKQNLVASTYAQAAEELLSEKKSRDYDYFIQAESTKGIINQTEFMYKALYRRNNNNRER